MGYKRFEDFQSVYCKVTFSSISLTLSSFIGTERIFFPKVLHEPFSFHFSTLPLGTSKCFFVKVFLKIVQRKKENSEKMFALISAVLRSLLTRRVKEGLMWQFYEITLPVTIPNQEKKLTYIFVFILLCGASEGLMKAFKPLNLLRHHKEVRK